MNRLIFETVGTGKTYAIKNISKGEIIGFVYPVRNGQWMHNSLVIPLALMKECVNQKVDLTFSPGCLDEIREFCKELNGKKKK